MKSKQLANVLIKMLGLYALVSNLHMILGGVFAMMRAGRDSVMGSDSLFIATAVLAVFVGIFLIVKSRTIAELLFGNEDE